MEGLRVSAELPDISVGTHSFRQRYLYAFAPQGEMLNHLRTQAVEQELVRIPEIMQSWEALQPRVAELTVAELGVAEEITLSEIPQEFSDQVGSFRQDPLFQKTFSMLQTTFAIVEVDKLVAPQRTVNLDYVDRLTASYPSNPKMEDLLRICVSPKREMDPIQHLEVGANTHVFSSPNSDIRFLGAFVKHLTPADLDFAVMGGLPAAAVIAFIGYGGAPVNVLKVGQRTILNNGFHRVYALRSLGAKEIPVVVQHVRNPQLEVPPQVAGLPTQYLLNAPRPVLMKDFLEPDFSVTLRVQERLKMVTVGIGLNQHDVPS